MQNPVDWSSTYQNNNIAKIATNLFIFILLLYAIMNKVSASTEHFCFGIHVYSNKPQITHAYSLKKLQS